MIFEVGFLVLVSPKGHQVHTLTNMKKEPYKHSLITAISTLLLMGISQNRVAPFTPQIIRIESPQRDPQNVSETPISVPYTP